MSGPVPAVMQVIGWGDWKVGGTNCPKVLFLRSVASQLKKLGWRPGFRLAIGSAEPLDIKGWTGEAAALCRHEGWALTCHPSRLINGMSVEGKLSEDLVQLGHAARDFNDEYDLQALILHPDVLDYDPPETEEVKDWHYLSQLTEEQVYARIKRQVVPSRRLNRLCGGILMYEPVHIDLYNQRTASLLPVTLAMALGYLDVMWLVQRAGLAGVACDGEHLRGTIEAAWRRGGFARVRRIPEDVPWTAIQRKIHAITGWRYVKGFHPEGIGPTPSYDQLIQLLRPQLFHVGAGYRLVNPNGEIGSHLEPDFSDRWMRNTVLLEIDWTLRNGGIGLEVEVDNYPDIAGVHAADNTTAKMRTFLNLMDAIEKFQRGIWQIEALI